MKTRTYTKIDGSCSFLASSLLLGHVVEKKSTSASSSKTVQASSSSKICVIQQASASLRLAIALLRRSS